MVTLRNKLMKYVISELGTSKFFEKSPLFQYNILNTIPYSLRSQYMESMHIHLQYNIIVQAYFVEAYHNHW